tara:strand:+ start:561 stop:1121 length:561 start_codon:yes stop_codon:yes gene_type:complete
MSATADSEGKKYQHDVNRVEAIFAALPNERYVNVDGMDTTALKAFAKKRKLDLSGISEKTELQTLVSEAKHDECGICMEPFLERQWVKTTWCGHQFHWHCLGEAVLARASTATKPRTGPLTCPICLSDLKKPLENGAATSSSSSSSEKIDPQQALKEWKESLENLRRQNHRLPPGAADPPGQCAQQ